MWGTESSMTNVIDLHTCPARSVHLIMARVLVPDGEPLQLAGNVIGGARVSIPVCVNVVGGCRCGGALLWSDIGGVKPLVALQDGVARLVTELAAHSTGAPTIVVVVAISTATALATRKAPRPRPRPRVCWPPPRLREAELADELEPAPWSRSIPCSKLVSWENSSPIEIG